MLGERSSCSWRGDMGVGYRGFEVRLQSVGATRAMGKNGDNALVHRTTWKQCKHFRKKSRSFHGLEGAPFLLSIQQYKIIT